MPTRRPKPPPKRSQLKLAPRSVVPGAVAVFPRPPDPAAVARLADDAARAVRKLYTEILAGHTPESDPVAVVAASITRNGIEVLRDLVVEREDPDVVYRRQLFRAFGRLRGGVALRHALSLTEFYAGRLEGNDRVDIAREYLEELHRLDLDELAGRSVPLEVVAAELAGEVGRKGGKPRGPTTILARILVLHRDGRIDSAPSRRKGRRRVRSEVDKLRDAIEKAEERHAMLLAKLGADDT